MTKRSLSNILAVAYKEATVLRHDQALLAMVLAQPIIMFVLFGLALSNKPANVSWAVLDRANVTASRRLVDEIQTTGYFTPPQRVGSYEAGRTLLRGEEILALLVIPSDFGRDIERGRPRVQLLVDGSDPLASARVSAYISNVAARVDVGRAPPPRHREAPGPAGPGSVEVRQRFWFNPNLRDRDFFLSGLAGMLLTNFCLSGTSLGLVAERETGTYEQMLALPTTPLEIVLGKLLPFVVIAYGLLLVSIALPGIVFGLWPAGSWVALLVVTLPFVLASLGIGVFVSALAHTSAQAVFITVFFILPSFVLSGVMFPYQFMPDGVRHLGYAFPLRWYQIALRRIIERGAGFAEVAVPFAALSAIFVVTLAGVRWRMRPRLE
jgi:ABC-2 type transport system permease protein